MTIRSIRLASALAALALAGRAAAGELGGFALQIYEPPPPGDRFFTVAGTGVEGHLEPSAGLVFSWAKDPLLLRQNGAPIPKNRIVGSQPWAFALVSMPVLDRVLLDLNLPIALGQWGEQPFADLAQVRSTALGDLKLGARTPLPSLGPVKLAAVASLWLPTGDRDAFASDGTARGRLGAAAGGELPGFPVEWGAGVAVLVRENRDAVITRTGTALSWSAAAAWRFGALRVGPEAYGRYQPSGTATSPYELLVGAAYAWRAWDLGLATGYAPADSVGGAPFRVLLRAAWRPDARPAAPAPAPPTPAPAPAEVSPPAPEPAPVAAPVPVVVPAPEPPPAPAPPPDRDGDGVADDTDACPDAAGVASADPSRNGCPALAVVTATRIEILQQIQFESGKAVIRPESELVLRDVASVLAAHPEIRGLRVEGHTDNQGDATFNTVLSERRANAVKAWLVERGAIEAARLEAKGFGPTQPISENRTRDGRARNRRVEFRLP